jgi:hypothetical protein
VVLFSRSLRGSSWAWLGQTSRLCCRVPRGRFVFQRATPRPCCVGWWDALRQFRVPARALV